MDVINSMAFSPDEKILAISFEDAVKLLDINTGNTRSLGVIFNNSIVVF